MEAHPSTYLILCTESASPFQVVLSYSGLCHASKLKVPLHVLWQMLGKGWSAYLPGDILMLVKTRFYASPAVMHPCLTMAQHHAGPPSNYNEDGVLTTELSSLSDLRLIRAAARPPATHLQVPTATVTPSETITTSVTDTTGVNPAAGAGKTPAGNSRVAAAAAASAAEGDESTQQASASMVPNVGAWAELSNQIAQRKAELASKAGGSSMAAHGDESGAVVTEGKVKVTGMQTPGAARPRGGVRASAMGPMLAFLRSSGDLNGNAA